MQTKFSQKVDIFLVSPAGERFLKLVGMLGSEHDGERANASAKANGLLRSAELTWGEVMGAGPAPSRGGQETSIRDMEARLKIERNNSMRVQAQLQAERNTANILRKQVRDLETKIRGDATSGVHNPAALLQKVQRLERENAEIQKALIAALKGEEPKAGTKKKPNKTGDRHYATDFQRDLNETIDEIEAAIDLNEWEQGFCGSLRNYKIRISEKQWDHLSRLARQAHVEVKMDPI